MSNSLQPMDCSPSGSSVHRFPQARILEWVAIPTAGDLTDPEIKPAFPGSSALVWQIFTTEPAAAAAKSLQSCPTLCDSIEGRPPGSAVPGILQARTLEWAAICFSNA